MYCTLVQLTIIIISGSSQFFPHNGLAVDFYPPRITITSVATKRCYGDAKIYVGSINVMLLWCVVYTDACLITVSIIIYALLPVEIMILYIVQ
jgi:hypothetical protein